MPAVNFKKQFAPDVESGKKRQTIRAFKKCGNPKEGCKLFLYTGMRTQYCKKLREETCISVEAVTIDEREMTVAENPLSASERHQMAIADGFECWDELVEFFRNVHSLPFFGLLIKW